MSQSSGFLRHSGVFASHAGLDLPDKAEHSTERSFCTLNVTHRQTDTHRQYAHYYDNLQIIYYICSVN